MGGAVWTAAHWLRGNNCPYCSGRPPPDASHFRPGPTALCQAHLSEILVPNHHQAPPPDEASARRWGGGQERSARHQDLAPTCTLDLLLPPHAGTSFATGPGKKKGWAHFPPLPRSPAPQGACACAGRPMPPPRSPLQDGGGVSKPYVIWQVPQSSWGALPPGARASPARVHQAPRRQQRTLPYVQALARPASPAAAHPATTPITTPALKLEPEAAEKPVLGEGETRGEGEGLGGASSTPAAQPHNLGGHVGGQHQLDMAAWPACKASAGSSKGPDHQSFSKHNISCKLLPASEFISKRGAAQLPPPPAPTCVDAGQQLRGGCVPRRKSVGHRAQPQPSHLARGGKLGIVGQHLIQSVLRVGAQPRHCSMSGAARGRGLSGGG